MFFYWGTKHKQEQRQQKNLAKKIERKLNSSLGNNYLMKDNILNGDKQPPIDDADGLGITRKKSNTFYGFD